MTYEEIVEFVRKNLTKTGAKTVKKNVAVEFDIYGEGEGAFYVAVNDGVLHNYSSMGAISRSWTLSARSVK